MEFPFRCPHCRGETWINPELMESRRIAKLMWAQGFSCSCGNWVPVFFYNVLMEQEIRKLHGAKKNFSFHFSKLLKRAVAMREKGMEIWQEQRR